MILRHFRDGLLLTLPGVAAAPNGGGRAYPAKALRIMVPSSPQQPGAHIATEAAKLARIHKASRAGRP